MLTLYYSPGACSMAPHIALEEAGAPYTLQLVSIPKGEQQAAKYLNVNPRGKVPTLMTDEGVLTENVAILTYIARSSPHAKLLPDEPLGMPRCNGDRRVRQQFGMRRREGDIGQDRDVLGKHALVGH